VIDFEAGLLFLVVAGFQFKLA